MLNPIPYPVSDVHSHSSALVQMLELELAIEQARESLASAHDRGAQRAAWTRLAHLVKSRSEEAVLCLEILRGLRRWHRTA